MKRTPTGTELIYVEAIKLIISQYFFECRTKCSRITFFISSASSKQNFAISKNLSWTPTRVPSSHFLRLTQFCHVQYRHCDLLSILNLYYKTLNKNFIDSYHFNSFFFALVHFFFCCCSLLLAWSSTRAAWNEWHRKWELSTLFASVARCFITEFFVFVIPPRCVPLTRKLFFYDSALNIAASTNVSIRAHKNYRLSSLILLFIATTLCATFWAFVLSFIFIWREREDKERLIRSEKKQIYSTFHHIIFINIHSTRTWANLTPSYFSIASRESLSSRISARTQETKGWVFSHSMSSLIHLSPTTKMKTRKVLKNGS